MGDASSVESASVSDNRHRIRGAADVRLVQAFRAVETLQGMPESLAWAPTRDELLYVFDGRAAVDGFKCFADEVFQFSFLSPPITGG
jgi:hypothetical protein